MKVVVLAFAVIASASVAVLGQGQFVFNNRVLPDTNARFVVDSDSGTSSSSVGTNFTVALFNQAAPGVYIPLVPPSTTFRGLANTTSAGYVVPTTETVPGTVPGEHADIVVRVFCPNGGQQDFGPYAITLGGGLLPPPNLSLGTSPLVLWCWEPPKATLVSPGFRSWGDFGFGLEATGWTQLVIEASSDLVAWLPINTNQVFTIPLSFADRQSTNYSRRFYRASLRAF